MLATDRNVFLIFVRRLGDLGIRYIVTGSVASIAYGEARLTHDVDIVVEIPREDVGRLPAAFPADEFYLPPREVITIEVTRAQRGHFNIIHHETGFQADIYPCGHDPLSAWGLRNARTVVVEGCEVRFASPEYVILRKLEYYREGGSEKHLRDIEGILAVSGDLVNVDEIETRAELLGVRPQWEALLADRKVRRG
ncbi:MAG: hypothetical protein HY899_19800 [Deltaproteobacteria bacterium]|nr:hypothetical protein [Deltaproteobacteria bacterium]